MTAGLNNALMPTGNKRGSFLVSGLWPVGIVLTLSVKLIKSSQPIKEAAMNKQEQFLLFVQTGVLANCINLKKENMTGKELANISATFVIGFMRDAFDASEKIPDDLSAVEAADDFLGYMLSNLREPNANVPQWFARH
jgi:hypothetical protein